MSKAFHSFSPYSLYPFDDNKVRTIFDWYLLNPSDTVIILAKADEQTIGILVGKATELYFSNTKVAGEIIWWVDNEYRRTKAGIKLFHAFEYWAKEIGVNVISGVNTTDTTDIGKFYIRNGYHLAETTFIKDI